MTKTNLRLEPIYTTFTIENFSNCEQYCSHEFFHPANQKIKFILDFYPKGDAHYITSYSMVRLLFQKSDRESDEARYRLGIVGHNGEKCLFQEGKLKRSKFNYGNFTQINFKRDFLLDAENGFLHNNKLTIYCEINLSSEMKSTRPKHNPQHQELSDNLNQALASKEFSDITLVVGEKEFAAHKIILSSRSPVFGAMFQSEMIETQKNRVQIVDIDCEVFEHFLNFIYTANIPPMEPYAMELFVAADKYQLISLRNECELHLIETLSIETAAGTLAWADLYSAINLKKRCIEYINQNSGEVRKTDGWKELVKNPKLLLELYENISEKLVDCLAIK